MRPNARSVEDYTQTGCSQLRDRLIVKMQPVPGTSRSASVPPIAWTARRLIESPRPDTGAIVAALRERQEKFFGPARWQTAALIGDLDEHMPRGNARGQSNVAPGLRELERVLQQVGESGRKHFAIGRDRQPRGDRHCECHTAGGRDRSRNAFV